MVIFFKYIILSYLAFTFLFSYNKSIDVITTNDLHGSLDLQKAYFINPSNPPDIIGSSGFSYYVNNLRDEVKENSILLLDGGNFFQGHPLGIADSGKTVIEWMNKIKYDALVPGNYDFLFGIDNLVKLSKIAEFSFLAANLYYEDSNSLIFKPYKIIDYKDISIGIIGIVNPNLNNIVLSQNLNNIMLKDPIKVLQNTIEDINDQTDLIILLTSAGIPWDREEEYKEFIENSSEGNHEFLNTIKLGYYADGIDVIVSGGISKGYPDAWYDPHSHVYAFQNYGGGTSFGHFILKYNPEYKLFTGYESGVTNQNSQTLFIHDFRYDKIMFDWINQKSTLAINKIYQPTNWNASILPDNNNNNNNKSTLTNDWDIPAINIPENLDIITWNCEFFPTANDSTIKALSEAIHDLDSDIIAFQEIKNRGWFSQLMDFLPKYDYIISQQSSFMDQAIIYKKDDFRLVNRLELFSENDYNFAGRPPLKADFVYEEKNINFSIINLHMKCCDSGLERRKKAAKMLYDYLSDEINNNNNIIVLGDWNDDLKDEDEAHCFSSFLNDERFYFPTMDITYDISKASYPKEPYVSFLDHILVSSRFVDKANYIVDTVPMNKYMGSYATYETYISDHMPVYLSFPY